VDGSADGFLRDFAYLARKNGQLSLPGFLSEIAGVFTFGSSESTESAIRSIGNAVNRHHRRLTRAGCHWPSPLQGVGPHCVTDPDTRWKRGSTASPEPSQSHRRITGHAQLEMARLANSSQVLQASFMDDHRQIVSWYVPRNPRFVVVLTPPIPQ